MLAGSGRRRAEKPRGRHTRRLAAVGIVCAAIGLPLAGAENAQAATVATYTVQPGDTLTSIATTHDVRGGWQQLYNLNRSRLTHGPDMIYPGESLTLSGTTTTPAAAPSSVTSYPDTLSGWISQAQAVLAAHGLNVPSYAAMNATAMAESSGNPDAVNNSDSNAANGTPSIGLAQMIQPTFNAYALPDHTDIYNPVDNLIAASRYCDAVYGSMDTMAAARGYGTHWYGY